jgi:nucleotide-binding universal stress UspA family protein
MTPQRADERRDENGFMNTIRYKDILVALDASPRAPGVLAAAIAIARAAGARLTLLRIVGIPLDIPPEALIAPGKLAEILEDRARRDLEEAARSIPPELFRKASVRVGVPWQAICKVAKEEDVDLILIGSHGYSGIDRLVGTTASRVVDHTDRSVLVVRDSLHPSA